MKHDENTKISYTLLVEQDRQEWWFVSGPPGLLVTGATMAAALSEVPQVLIDISMVKAISSIGRDMAKAIVPEGGSDER